MLLEKVSTKWWRKPDPRKDFPFTQVAIGETE